MEIECSHIHAETEPLYDPEYFVGWIVYCPDCKYSTIGFFQTEDAANASWDRGEIQLNPRMEKK